jgi:hypothetical protein
MIAIFMLDFVAGMGLPQNLISEKIFPKTYAWFERYRAAVEKAKSSAPEPTTLDGEAAAKYIHASETGQSKLSVDENDPTGLREGSEIEVYGADWGTDYRDRGQLVGLSPDEVTIAVKSRAGAEIRIHAPRTGFKINKL